VEPANDLATSQALELSRSHTSSQTKAHLRGRQHQRQKCAYRARLKTDPEAREDAAMVQTKHLILREERNFVELVDGAFKLPSKLPGPS